MDVTDLSISKEALQELFHIDKNLWKNEVEEIKDYFKIFAGRLPVAFKEEIFLLETRLQ